MSMRGEIEVERTIKKLCKELEEALKGTDAQDPMYREGIKYAGRQALTLFDWDIPKWAAEYERLFRS
jgi:hypothetical protein